MSTPRDYEGSLDAIVRLVELIDRTAGEQGTVGIGIPGMISQRTGVVKNANSTWLIGKPLGAALEERLGRPVRLMNDANCFTLSEATDGAGAGFDGGRLREEARECIVVRADHMGRIEDGHFVIQHLVVYYFMSMLHAEPAAAAPASASHR